MLNNFIVRIRLYFSSILLFILDSSTNDIRTNSAHRNTYSPEITTNKNRNSYDSQSPVQQSLTSDISVMEDINTQSKQKKPLPNFFPSNREMEVSMKQVSEASTTSVNYFFTLIFTVSLCLDIK